MSASSSVQLPASAADDSEDSSRPWFEDPEWISEICRSLRFRERFRYRPGHINVNEARVVKSWVKSLSKEVINCRAVALLDSRVTIGAAAKGEQPIHQPDSSGLSGVHLRFGALSRVPSLLLR